MVTSQHIISGMIDMIRAATVEDSRQIAQVHVSSWQTTYINQVPQSILDSLSVEKRSETWEKILSESIGSILVYEENGEVLGFTHYGKSRDGDTGEKTAELYSIYVLEPHKNRGIGTQLWNRALAEMKHEGFSEVIVWVLGTNVRALSFYTKVGFAPDGTQKMLSLPDFEAIEIRCRLSLA